AVHFQACTVDVYPPPFFTLQALRVILRPLHPQTPQLVPPIASPLRKIGRAHETPEIMQAHLGAGSASCQKCVEPFGRLEDFRAPFMVACGHVFCLLCLHDERANAAACCPLCRTPYDRTGYLRLAGLAGTVPHRLRSFDMGAKLRGEIARVDGLTNDMQLRTLHDDARRFLDSQPRNRFTDLEINVRLLGCFLEAKETAQAQATVVNALVEQVHQLGADKAQMHRQLRDAERQYAREREYVRSRVYDLIRQDP
ncbi:hypothetical protein HYPSUDRAFT_683447, partial [Hypholoma sublateritium FD-334 SS-4]